MPKVFISYSSTDHKYVEEIAQKLKFHGIEVWYDQWEIGVGDSIVQKINDGISSADYLLVALSSASVKSHWVQEELSAATALLAEKGSFILPVLLDDCKVPPLLAHRKYANYQKDPSEAIEQIVEAIRGLRGSGGKPDPVRASHAILSTMISGYARQIKEANTAVERSKIKGELIGKISSIAEREEMPPEVFIVYVDRMLATGSWLTLPELLISLQDPQVIKSWSTEVGQKIAEWTFRIMLRGSNQDLPAKDSS